MYHFMFLGSLNYICYRHVWKMDWKLPHAESDYHRAKNDELEKFVEETSVRHLRGKLDEQLKNRSKRKSNKQRGKGL